MLIQIHMAHGKINLISLFRANEFGLSTPCQKVAEGNRNCRPGHVSAVFKCHCACIDFIVLRNAGNSAMPELQVWPDVPPGQRGQRLSAQCGKSRQPRQTLGLASRTRFEVGRSSAMWDKNPPPRAGFKLVLK